VTLAPPVGWVGATDFDWYRFLHTRWSEHRRLDEVNFWQPGGSRDFHAIPPGSPFFFKLKSPHNAVAGFGYFARASRIPLSLAWEAFREANGVPDLPHFRTRLGRLREGGLRAGDDPTIGCLMISEPTFFEPGEWVPQPADWSRNIVSGKRYALDAGEGRRLLADCLDRVGTAGAPDLTAALAGEPGSRFGAARLVTPRLGQGTFRVAVTDSYGRACAVTGEHSLPVLEAAHIRPFAEEGPHLVTNGLCLRSDVHRLFDRGYVTVDPKYRFRVSPRLKELWSNGKAYYALDGKLIAVPRREDERPDPALLLWHGRERFLG
jgi:putative restriction endonuclease